MVHSKRHFRKAPDFAGVAFFFGFAWVLGALTGYGLASGFHAEASPGRRPHLRRMVYCDCSGHGSIFAVGCVGRLVLVTPGGFSI